MPELAVRTAAPDVRVIAIAGDLTAASEAVLMDAYLRSDGGEVRAVVLDFTALDYMNSGGIGLLVQAGHEVAARGRVQARGWPAAVGQRGQ